MTLVFGDVRLDLGKLPDLMPQRLGIAAAEPLTAAAALGRLEFLHLVAVLAGNQRPLVLRVSRLTAPPLLRLPFLDHRLGVEMLRTGRQRRILRRFAPPRPKLGGPGPQRQEAG